MLRKITLLTALLVLSIAAAGQSDFKIAATWQVQKYDLAVTLPTTETDRSLQVRARLDLKNVSNAAASTLTLRISPQAEVASVSVAGSAVDFTKGEEKAGTGTLQKVVVRLSSVSSGGNVAVSVDYKLNLKENSGLAVLTPVRSQFLPLSFWYPTPNSWFFARGADYAPFRIEVTSQGSEIISAGTASGKSFETKLRAQPFFAAGNWQSITAGGVAVYFPKGMAADGAARASELAAVANEAQAFLVKFLGTAPETQLKIVSANRGVGFSSAGTVLIDEGIFRRPKIDSLTVLAIVEAVAKSWLGGSVTVEGDGDGAIREGLAKYLATLFIESKYGGDTADVERLRERSAYAAVVARDAPITAVSPLDDYYFSVVANKGAMIWRLLSKKVGETAFVTALKSAVEDRKISLAELRAQFPAEKAFLDYSFDQVTDMNLQAGLPQQSGGDWRAALRNSGSVDATVDVTAVLANGETLSTQTTVRAKSFGEVTFKSAGKLVSVEIDEKKLYPQTNYSDDIAPRQFTENDPLLSVKRLFDKQDFSGVERAANTFLKGNPRLDEVRVLLGRALLAQGKNAQAEREFQLILQETLPTARSITWASAGLAEIAAKGGQTANASKFAEAAIVADADYGASLAARSTRAKLATPQKIDDQFTSFFNQFDKAAASNRKAELVSLTLTGDVAKFASGIAGQTEQWKTELVAVDLLTPEIALVEGRLTIKLLNRDVQAGTVVYRLVKTPAGWKLSSVDVFEVK